MLLTDDDHMVKTLPAKCANNSFAKRILPWTSWCSWCVFKPKSLYGLLELMAEDFIIITYHIFGGFIESKGFTKLLNCPLRVRICSNRKVEYSTSIV